MSFESQLLGDVEGVPAAVISALIADVVVTTGRSAVWWAKDREWNVPRTLTVAEVPEGRLPKPVKAKPGTVIAVYDYRDAPARVTETTYEVVRPDRHLQRPRLVAG